MFRHNVGGLDRVLRLTLGGTPAVVLAVVGVLVLLTGIIRFCALYVPFGISTAKPRRPPLNQVCDCAACMKAMPDNRPAVAPPKEQSAEAMAAARDR